MTAGDTEADAILRRLEDEREIRNLLAMLSHLADHGKVDDYIALWAPDGVWQGSTDVARGRNELRARVEAYRARGIQGPGSHARHVCTTQFVEFTGPDSARSESYFVYFTNVDTAPRPTRVGRYVDELNRVDGRWRLSRRRIVLTD